MKNIAAKLRENIWITISILSLTALVIVIGSGQGRIDPSQADDIEDIDALITEFQTAYSTRQADDLRNMFYAEAIVAYDFDAGERQRTHSIADWIQGTQENVFDANDYISDVLSNREIVVFRNIAYAVCDYVYTDDDEIGRGVDIFTFMKTRDRWKILSLQFTGDEYPR